MLSFLASSRSFLRPPEKQPGNAARIRHGEFDRVRPHLVRDPLHQRPDFEDYLAAPGQRLEHSPKALGGRLDLVRAMGSAVCLAWVEHVEDT